MMEEKVFFAIRKPRRVLFVAVIVLLHSLPCSWQMERLIRFDLLQIHKYLGPGCNPAASSP